MALPPNNRKGSGYTNINRVLTANQGNSLGQNVVSGVQNTANQVRNNVQQSQQNFQQEAQKNRLDTEEAKKNRDQTIGRFASPVAGTQQVANNVAQTQQANSVAPIKTAQAGPAVEQTGAPNFAKQSSVAQPTAQSGAVTAIPVNAATEQEIADFQKYRTGTYAGPKELTDYQTLLGGASDVDMMGDQTRSIGGRQELLKRIVGGQGYTAGQQKLDNLLLGQSGNALNEARVAGRGLVNEVSNANSAASNLAGEFVNRAKIFGGETVNKINDAIVPISTEIDTKLKSLQDQDALRKNNFNYLQGVLGNTDAQVQKLDRITRLGLGLQAAKDSGYINDTQVAQLLGDKGLIQRAENIGLDTNKLLNERFTNTAAKNLTRAGIATDDQKTRLNSLNQLLGKQSTDLEFSDDSDYGAGNAGFDLNSLKDYISKAEQERAAGNAKKLADIEEYNSRYLNQGMAGVQQFSGGVMQAGGGALNQTLNPQASVNPGLATQNFNNIVQGYGNAGAGAIHVADNASNSLLEGLVKLNIGGNSLANTEGGRQLLKAIELKNKMVNEITGTGQQIVNGAGNTIQDLGSGDFQGAYNNSIGTIGNIASTLNKNIADEIAKSEAGRALGNVGNTVGNVGGNISSGVKSTVKSAGGAVKSAGKKAKKVFSDKTLKHEIKPADNKLYALLDKLNAAEYKYDEKALKEGAFPGKNISVMAQDLEKSDLGDELVDESNPTGKMVDYDKAEPIQLAALASIHKRLKKLEGK